MGREALLLSKALWDTQGDIKKMCDVLNGRYGDLQNINQIETTPVVTPWTVKPLSQSESRSAFPPGSGLCQAVKEIDIWTDVCPIHYLDQQETPVQYGCF